MPQLQQLADSMLAAAGAVLGRLVDFPVTAGTSARHDHQGSIHTDGSELIAVCSVPSLAIGVVARFESADISRVVGLMLGGGDEGGEMGAMQLSIVSETVTQIAVAMAERLATELGASLDDIRAEVCTDATNIPPPPFESYQGTIRVGSDVEPRIAIDFDGIAAGKIAAKSAPPRVAHNVPNAQTVAFVPMAPTPRAAQSSRGNLDMVHDVPLQISAVLGKAGLTLREVVSLAPGSVFELDKLSSEPIDLYVNNILIARGEVVVVDDTFAVKISELNPNAA
ncbi:MAG: flagellar motor switch protein FliN [Candidatus Eremiobacteraeota bacterium]|nr:flagellar motor switch protein FliN [Candidatus Eremiobacteraeota bacterium]